MIIFEHGEFSRPAIDSAPGYLYLCELLATHGVISLTIDSNFLIFAGAGNTSPRGILMLEHIKQFKEWNEDSSHPLYQKIETDENGFPNVIFVGHSRGWESAGIAGYFCDISKKQGFYNNSWR